MSGHSFEHWAVCRSRRDHQYVASAGDIEGVDVNGFGVTVLVGFDLRFWDKLLLGVDANFEISSAKVSDSE